MLSIRDSGTNKYFGFHSAVDLFCPNPGFEHTTKKQSDELRLPSPRCSASTSGDKSQNIHSHWTNGPQRWTRTAANFSKNTHRNHDRSGRDL